MSPREAFDATRKWKVNASTAALFTLLGVGITIGTYKARFEDQQIAFKDAQPLIQQVPVLIEQVKLLQETTSAVQHDQGRMKEDIAEIKTSLDIHTRMIMDKIGSLGRTPRGG